MAKFSFLRARVPVYACATVRVRLLVCVLACAYIIIYLHCLFVALRSHKVAKLPKDDFCIKNAFLKKVKKF